MPSELVSILRVDEWPDAEGRAFSVYVVKTSGPTVTTLSPFQASLCQRANDLGKRAIVKWSDGPRHAKRLIGIELEATYGPVDCQ